jgi:hypothetical protein
VLILAAGKQERSAGSRLGSFPQARAYARRQITRKQAGGRWCRSRAGAAHRRCDQARWSCRRLRGYAGRVLRHTRVSRGGLAHKQEDLEVREGVGIANQFGSIVSSQGSTTSSNSYPSGHSPPTTIPGKLFRHPRNLVTVEHFSPSILFTAEIHFPLVLLHNQVYLKVCPDPLNLPSTGKPLCRNIIIFFLFSVFPDQGLNCFDLESSRVFSRAFFISNQ